MIDHYGLSAEELASLRILDCWNWLLGSGPWVPVVFSPFGDVFLASKDGHVHCLNILEGELSEVAPSRAEFGRLDFREASAVLWFNGPLVDQLLENGIVRGKGQIYGYRKLPHLGGEIRWENVDVMNPVSYHSALSQIHQQRKDLPAEIRISRVRPAAGPTRKPSRKWWQLWK